MFEVNDLEKINREIDLSTLLEIAKECALIGNEILIKRVNIIIKKLLLIIPNFFKKITH